MSTRHTTGWSTCTFRTRPPRSKPGARLQASYHHAELDQLALGYLSYGAEMLIDLDEPDHCYVLEVPISGALVLRRTNEEFVCVPHAPAMLTATEAVGKHWSHDCAVLLVCFRRVALETWLAHLLDHEPNAPPRFALGTTPGNIAMKGLIRNLRWVLGELDQYGGLLEHPAVVTAMQRQLMTELLYAYPHTHSEALHVEPSDPGKRAVDTARDWLHAHPDQPLDLVTPAREAGVSEPSLRWGFTRRQDTPPAVYQRRLRLRQAAAELRAALAGEIIGELIRRERERAGMSEQAFADALNAVAGTATIDQPTVSRWENGEVIPSPRWRRHIAEVLDLPLERLDRAAAGAEILRLARSLADTDQQ